MRTAHARELEDSALEEGLKAFDERPKLTNKQVEYLHIYTAGPYLSESQLCKHAGVTPAKVKKWKQDSPRFMIALQTEHRRSRQVSNMSRKSVMRGMLEAIEIAKDLHQPGGMISGWKEIGRMCGFYEPEKREIRLSVDGRQMIEEMKTISKEKLMQLASDQDVVEAEFEVIEDPVYERVNQG